MKIKKKQHRKVEIIASFVVGMSVVAIGLPFGPTAGTPMECHAFQGVDSSLYQTTYASMSSDKAPMLTTLASNQNDAELILHSFEGMLHD